jgi:hypothetical protein
MQARIARHTTGSRSWCTSTVTDSGRRRPANPQWRANGMTIADRMASRSSSYYEPGLDRARTRPDERNRIQDKRPRTRGERVPQR